MKKIIRGILAIPLCIISAPVFIGTFTMLGLIPILGIIMVLTYPFHWLSDNQEGMKISLEGWELTFYSLFGIFPMWYEWYKTGKLKFD